MSSPLPSGSASPSASGQGSGDPITSAPQEQISSPPASGLGGFTSVTGALPATTTSTGPSIATQLTGRAAIKARADALRQRALAVQARLERQELEQQAEQAQIAEEQRRAERERSPITNQELAPKKEKVTYRKPDTTQINTQHPSFRCFVQADNRQPIGGIKTINGYQIRVEVNGGRFGDASLTLHFKSNKLGHKAEPLARNDKDQEHFQLQIFPGMKTTLKNATEATFMVNRFDAQYMREINSRPTPAQEMVWKQTGENSRDLLIQLRFILVDYTRVGTAHEPSWRQHGDAVCESVETILAKDAIVHLWFQHDRKDSYFESTIVPFLYAFQERLPLHHQYFTNGALDLRLDRLSIKDTGDGMYCKPLTITTYSGGNDQGDRSNGLIDFYTLPYRNNWVTKDDFKAYAGGHVVREYQYQKAQTVSWQFRECQVFLMRLWTTFTIGSERVTVTANQYTPTARDVKNSYVAFIRSPSKETPPAENTRVEVQFGTRDSDRANKWYGVIIRREVEELKLTGTDFAALIQKPFEKGKYVPATDGLVYRKHLPKVRVKVLQSDKAANRELDGLEALVESPHEQCQRVLTLLHKPISTTKKFIDVTGGPTDDPLKKVEFHKALHVLKKEKKLNKDQFQALLGLQAIPDYVLMIIGSPGTGKTTNLRDSVWLMVGVGHKVTVFASTNAALDNVTNAIYAADRPDQPKDKKVLRLEVGAAEELAMLRSTVLDQARDQDEEINLQDPPKWTENDDLYLEDPAYLFTLEKMEAAETENDLLLAEFMKQKNDLKAAYALVQEASQRTRLHNVPLATTLSYMMWALCQEDRIKAEDAYQAELIRITAESPNIADATRRRAEMGSVEDRDESQRFKQYRDFYISWNGKVAGRVRKEYQTLVAQMARRVLLTVDVLVISANNAGSDFAQLGFEPTLLYNDEGGQNTVANLAVPLTAYQKWLALIIYGDPKELKPAVMSKGFNEFILNAQTSPLEMLQQKGHRFIRFKEQYRMDPEISRFPNMRFYDGLVRNHAITRQDHSGVKALVRKMTLEEYDIQGPRDKKGNPSGKGALFFVRNVTESAARHEANSTSLQNFANANAILDQVGTLNRYGVTAEQITILTVYRGQAKLLVHKIRPELQADGVTLNKLYSEVTTIDSYQGKENEVVILDIVAANPKAGMYASEIDGLPEDLDEEDAAGSLEKGTSRRYDIFSSHVKDRSRLNVGLTRARSCLIIIVQVGGALWTSRAGKTGERKEKSDLAALMQYATRERIIYDDRDSVDDHPDAKKAMLQTLSARDKEFKASYDLAFIRERISMGHRGQGGHHSQSG